MATTPSKSHLRGLVDVLFIAVFFAALMVPAVAMLISPDDRRWSDKGESLEPWPFSASEIPSVKELPDKLGRYTRGRFGFRETLIKMHAWLNVELLATSTSPQVLLGKDHWLYFTGERSIEDHRGIVPMSEEEIAKIVDMMQGWQSFTNAHGIRLLVVLAPSKHTVYPELLPAWVTRLGKQTRADQLLSRLAAQTSIDVLDLREVMLAAKAGHPLLFSRTDSHWNDLGAYIAHEAIARRLARWFPSVAIDGVDAVQIEPTTNPKGDLARLMGYLSLPGDFFYVKTPTAPGAKEISATQVASALRGNSEDHRVFEKEGAPIPRAVIFRDSFMTAVTPFLVELFKHAELRWSRDFDYELVSAQCPDVVIFELVERGLMEWLPIDTRPSDEGKLAACTRSRPGAMEASPVAP